MKWQYKIENSRKLYNLVYIAIIVLLVFSLFFSNNLTVFLKLKPNYKFSNETEIHFINAGQGDAIAIKFDNGKVMLIDSGTHLYKKKFFNYLNNIILENNNTIDYLVLTHIDSDHSGNMLELLNSYEIYNLYRPKLNSTIEDINSVNSNEIYDKVISIAKNKNINLFYNEVGHVLSIGLSVVSWLSPIDISLDESLDSNNYSPVIRLDYKGNSALFTGDIDSDVENKLINTYKNGELDVDILKLAHHGSANSTSEEFLMATTPKFACISVGENTYGHPSNKLIERILKFDENFGANLYNNMYLTKSSGNVIMTLSDHISVSNISNIDDFNFVGYYVYALIGILVIAVFMLRPYVFILFKNIRFIIQNRKFEKYLKKETNIKEKN